MSIGGNIKRLRESRGMSQQELADIAGVTNKAVSTWERDSSIPRLGAVQKIADYFGIKRSEIMDGEIEKGVDSGSRDFIIRDGKILVYSDLPEEAQKELESFFQYLREKHKITEP